MPVVAANDITEEVVGKRLLDYSHNGEDPRSRTLQDQRVDFNNPPMITTIDTDNDDNAVTVVLGELADEYRRDASRQRVRDDKGNYIIDKIPGSGGREIGLSQEGWIEVTD